MWSASASAEVTLIEKDGWGFFTDGRVNAFLSMGFGDDFPEPSPNTDGGVPHDIIGFSALGAAGQNTEQDDANNKYFAMRVRNGFLGSVLGFGVKRKITNDGTTAKAYVALWGHAETNARKWGSPSRFDVRQGYVEFDGPWGNLLAGRNLGLFGRTSGDIAFLYGHNFGLGYPCGDDQGPTCGHIGTGVMFPGFAAGFAYTTPSLGGLRASVGLYDPVRLLGAWFVAPYARPEAQVTFEQKLGDDAMFKLGVEGVFQPVTRMTAANPNDPMDHRQVDQTQNVWGAAGGGRLEVGPVRVGVSAFRGKGLGQYYALQNSPAVFSRQTYNLRIFSGVNLQTALVLGKLQVSAGVGRVTADQLAEDKTDIGMSNLKHQTGVSLGAYYAIYSHLVLGIDYFRFQTDWWGAPRSDANGVQLPGYLPAEKQVMNYLNVGATVHW